MNYSRNEKFKGNKGHLLFLAGFMWSSIGISLLFLAKNWLKSIDHSYFYYLAGMLLAFTVHIFGFIKIASKNITRIKSMGYRKIPLFYFQSLKSYLLIIIMIFLGMYLRSSSIPKELLAIIYLGIGGALFLSSFRYYQSFIKIIYIK